MSDVRSESWQHPFQSRYASEAMLRVFSEAWRIGTWRKLWVELARAEASLGLPISEEQIEDLERTREEIDFERARAFERELRHDVMAHVHTWKEQCPRAGAILHLGATSCFVTDNSELCQMRAGLDLLLSKLRTVIRRFAAFCREHKDVPTLGYTHFQPAQLTTVGKRAALWLQDLLIDHEELRRVRDGLRFRGVKGTTGSQDSFLKLFDGDHAKVEELDRRITEAMGFERAFSICGQTYTRKQDALVLQAVSGLGQSAGKVGNDLRLLCHLQEVEEPFGTKQIGSSAMAYKRNPMRSERLCALSRWLLNVAPNAAQTASVQWLERSLDDSANRRLATSEAFLCADAILELLLNLSAGLVVRPDVIARHLQEKLSFIASEELMMQAAKRGGDRQELHELVRQAAHRAADRQKAGAGGDGGFLEEMAAHPQLGAVLKEMGGSLDPRRFTGRSAEQVEAFLQDEVEPLLAAHPADEHGDEVAV